MGLANSKNRLKSALGVPANNFLFAGRDPENNFFQNFVNQIFTTKV